MALKLSQLKKNVFRSRYIILDMLEKRGYNIDNYNSFTEKEIDTLFEQINSKVSTSPDLGPLDILVERDIPDCVKDKCLIKYRLDEKFKKSKTLEQQIIDIFKNNLDKDDTVIIMNINKIPFKKTKKESNVESFIDDIYSNFKYFVQIYGIENLLFNVSNHYIVPKHEIIYENEIKEVSEKYNINNLDNLPTIRREDPQAKYIGAKPGDIIKITRPSISNIKSIMIRYCVN
jgi:DNA-directed RNA polymerase subunit H (RpoH/RPB5)